jgi:NAD(P)-dependent dehydrogenase (short-subunit alcohol dehydrogenase family)
MAEGGRAWGYECDVTDAEAVARNVDLAFVELGGLSVVCNVAGIGQFYRTETLDPAVFDRIIAVNLRGTFLVCRYALPHLLEAGTGVIVNTTSVSGIVGNPWNAAYAASKGGVLMLTKALAAEYRHRGIRVNGVAPGPIWTPLIPASFPAEKMPEFGENVPLGRAGEPNEVAPSVLFLACADASYMTGQVLHPNGGSIVGG